MSIRKSKPQQLAAAKAGISERSARRIDANPSLPSQSPRRYWSSRPDPFADAAIRIEPELRAVLEAVLVEGESLSSFVESSVRQAVEYRQLQADFHARGTASWDEYLQTGESVSSAEVVAELRARTATRRACSHSPPPPIDVRGPLPACCAGRHRSPA